MSKAKCFDEKDRDVVESSIKTWYGNTESFEEQVTQGAIFAAVKSQIGDKSLLRYQDTVFMLMPILWRTFDIGVYAGWGVAFSIHAPLLMVGIPTAYHLQCRLLSPLLRTSFNFWVKLGLAVASWSGRGLSSLST